MKRYQFRLHTVLRLRRAEEEQAREALARANGHLRHAISTCEAESTRYRLLVGTARATTLEGLRAETLAGGLAASVIEQAKIAIASAAADVALAQVAWAATQRRVKILERLDERRRIEHAEDERRFEVATVDDVVTARYVSEADPSAVWA